MSRAEEVARQVREMGGGDLPLGKSMHDIYADNRRTAAAIAADRETEAKMEADARGHRGLRDGRDFRWNTFRYQETGDFVQEMYEKALPDSPGGGNWFNKRYCPDCDKVHSMCKCGEKEKGKDGE